MIDTFVSKINKLISATGSGIIMKKTSNLNHIDNKPFPNNFQDLFSLVYNYEPKDYDLDSFVLGSEILESDKYYLFARNHHYSADYVINKSSKQVLLIKENKIFLRCANDIEDFMSMIFIYIDIEILYETEENVNEDILREAYTNCINQLGKEYEEFIETMIVMPN